MRPILLWLALATGSADAAMMESGEESEEDAGAVALWRAELLNRGSDE